MQMVFQDPLVAESAAPRRRPRRRAAAGAQSCRGRGSAPRSRACFRWSVSARSTSSGCRTSSRAASNSGSGSPARSRRGQARRPRRADLGARRVRAGADHQPPPRAPARTGPDLPLHLARPGCRQPARPPDRRDVPQPSSSGPRTTCSGIRCTSRTRADRGGAGRPSPAERRERIAVRGATSPIEPPAHCTSSRALRSRRRCAPRCPPSSSRSSPTTPLAACAISASTWTASGILTPHDAGVLLFSILPGRRDEFVAGFRRLEVLRREPAAGLPAPGNCTCRWTGRTRRSSPPTGTRPRPTRAGSTTPSARDPGRARPAARGRPRARAFRGGRGCRTVGG